MAAIKTHITKASVPAFLAAVEEEEKRKDSKTLLKLFKEVTKEKPVLWSNSIIGFGSFHYKSERSKQEGDWFMTGFSPKKNYLAVYIIVGFKNYSHILKKLGKFKISTGSCLYINRLSDINMDALNELIKVSFAEMKLKYA